MRTIYYNGVVYTGALPLAEAFGEEDGVFFFAGTNEEALGLKGEGDCLVDLGGRFVCSGFNDSHMHLLSFGGSLRMAHLAEHTGSLADVVDCLRAFKESRSFREGDWIQGRGWNQDYFADVSRMPDRHDLDKVSTDIPICAERACGHCLVVNSRALSLLGIDADTPQPAGGRIGMDEDGPDGRFFDNAMDLVYRAIPGPDKEEVKEMMLAACRALNACGVTSSQSDDYCAFPDVPWTLVNEAYRELEKEGRLTVRVYEQSNFSNLEGLREFVEAGNRTGEGSSLFKIGPLKMLGDGSLGSRTAFLSRPYADDASTRGIPVFTQEALDEMAAYANAQGMQMAVHAIGDACLDRVLAAYEKALRACPRPDHRHGIVHCQITRPDQLAKISRMKLHVYAQSIFLDYDIHMVRERVGEELASTSYSWKTLLRGQTTVSNGSDCPVELPSVVAGIQCAVTRTTLRDHRGPYLPDEAFTVQEALDSYTIGGAYASFEEQVKGKIAPGMLADFVVLGENPFEVPADRLREISVEEVYLGGRRVFERQRPRIFMHRVSG